MGLGGMATVDMDDCNIPVLFREGIKVCAQITAGTYSGSAIYKSCHE